MSEPKEPTYTQVNVFDGGAGYWGQYTWRNLPAPMTKQEAEAYCQRLDWCPPERFRNGEPIMASKWLVDVKGANAGADGDYWLRTATQKFLEDNKYQIGDSGGGDGRWTIGVPFNDLEEAVVCLSVVTARFNKAIADGSLTVELKTWSRSCWKE